MSAPILALARPVEDRFATDHAHLTRWFDVRVRDVHLAEDLAMKVWVRCVAAERRGQLVWSSYIWDPDHGAAVSVLKDHWRTSTRKPPPISLDAWLAEREDHDIDDDTEAA